MFDELVSETLIGWIWILGSIGVVINGIMLMFSGGGGWGILLALIFIVVGLLVTRVVCESMVVIFKIHDNLKLSTQSLEQMERYQTFTRKQFDGQAYVHSAQPVAHAAQAAATRDTAVEAPPRLAQPVRKSGWESAYETGKD